MEFLLKGKHEITQRRVNPSKCLYTKLHSDEQLSPPLLQGPGVELAINLQLLGWEQFTAQGGSVDYKSGEQNGNSGEVVMREVPIVKAVITRTAGQRVDTSVAIFNSIAGANGVA